MSKIEQRMVRRRPTLGRRRLPVPPGGLTSAALGLGNALSAPQPPFHAAGHPTGWEGLLWAKVQAALRSFEFRSSIMPRRFPAPWYVNELEEGFVIQTARGQSLAFVYFRD
jgi:hypothetical protein